ncbi:hypothetical protein AB0I81_59540 [Nonomuraea sp. NPDC050404]|uniref:hypothetical protein n=1 Tax=Nonomuraea sp. NPDC050404 TaxID=3155783 RepID=UPI00340968E7
MKNFDQGISRRRLLTSALTVGGISMGLAGLPATAQAASSSAGSTARRAARAAARSAETWENIIEKTSFDSRTAFDQVWNLNYPVTFGDVRTHNGAAKMQDSKVSLSGGVMTLTATRLSKSVESSTHQPRAPIWWHSGAVHAKQQIVINDQFPEYDIEGEFRTDTGPGIWPAFWMTGADVWPPETDILEYVGQDGAFPENLFNTRNANPTEDTREFPDSGNYVTRTTKLTDDKSNPSSQFIKYRVWMYKDGENVKLEYSFGGNWVADHLGLGWAGIPMWLIINLQMGTYASGLDDSSPGWKDQLPGPTGDTYFRARNVWVGRTRAY